MQTIYRKIPVSEAHKEKELIAFDKNGLRLCGYITNKYTDYGLRYYCTDDHQMMIDVTHVLEAIELPSEEEIKNEFPLSYFSGAVQIDLPQNKLARKGAKYIIDMITKTK